MICQMDTGTADNTNRPPMRMSWSLRWKPSFTEFTMSSGTTMMAKMT